MIEHGKWVISGLSIPLAVAGFVLLNLYPHLAYTLLVLALILFIFGVLALISFWRKEKLTVKVSQVLLKPTQLNHFGIVVEAVLNPSDMPMRIEKFQLNIGNVAVSSVDPKYQDVITLTTKRESHRFTFDPLEVDVDKTRKADRHGQWHRYGKLTLYARGKWWPSKEFTF
jgi:hypothetical protein